MVTHKDIAKVVGVSQATVSKVLNNRANNIGISQKTRLAVIEAAKSMGYNKDKIASSLIHLVDKTIAVLVEHIANPFSGVIMSGIEEELVKTDYHFLFASSNGIDNQAIETIEMLSRRYTTGFILMPFYQSNTSQKVRQFLQNRGIPFVQTNYTMLPGENDAPLVCSNSREIVRRLTQHLIGLGHERIVFIYTSPNYSSIEQRILGFHEAMDEAGHKVGSSMLIEIPRDQYFDSEWKRQIIRRWMNSRRRPTAIMTIKDDCAVQFIRILEAMGMSVPGDMAVTGFDDYIHYIPKFYADDYARLTTVRQNLPEIGRQAVRRLIAEIEHPDSKSLPLVVEVPAEVIVRGSCGATTSQQDNNQGRSLELEGLGSGRFTH